MGRPVSSVGVIGGGVARLVRAPVAFWALTAAVSVISGLSALRMVDSTRTMAARYGPLRPVVMAVEAVDSGQIVQADQLAVRHVPASMVADGAVTRVGLAVGRTVVISLLPGVAVVEAALAPEGRGGVGALLDPGSRAVAIPLDTASPPLRIGDRVDVIATPPDGTDAEGSFVVAEAVRVVHVASAEAGDEAVTVDVASQQAVRIAYALATGVVSLALSAEPAVPEPPLRPRLGR